MLEIWKQSEISPNMHSAFHEAYGNDGARGRSSHSKSPQRPTFTGDAYRSYDSHIQNIGVQKIDGWDIERHGADVHSGRKFDYPAYPQRLEELEMEFKREAMEFGRLRDKEEDEENYKHREVWLLFANIVLRQNNFCFIIHLYMYINFRCTLY